MKLGFLLLSLLSIGEAALGNDLDREDVLSLLQQSSFPNGNDELRLVDSTWTTQRRQQQTTLDTYYKFKIEITPPDDWDPFLCDGDDRTMLQQDVFRALVDYGLTQAKEDLNSTISPFSCPNIMPGGPLATNGFVWTGAVGCKFCTMDDNDKRRRQLLGFMIDNSTLMQIANGFQNVLLTNVVPKYEMCLGSNPKISVLVFKATFDEVSRCLNGTNPDIEAIEAPCGLCNIVDFADDGFGEPIFPGSYVRTNWKASYGFTVMASSTSGGFFPSGQARVMDWKANAKDDTRGTIVMNNNLKKDTVRGSVKGIGGGKNLDQTIKKCREIRNSLIVQGSNNPNPKPNPKGGKLKFEFDNPVLLVDIGIMKVQESRVLVVVKYSNALEEIIRNIGLGKSKSQTINLNKVNVTYFEITFSGIGAVTSINICPSCLV